MRKLGAAAASAPSHNASSGHDRRLTTTQAPTSASRKSSVADDGSESAYERDNPAQNMLRLLRDAAHDLANQVHRDLRDLGHHYELAALLPSLTEPERRALVAKAGSLRRIREADEIALINMAGRDAATRAGADIESDRAGNAVAAVPFIVPIRFHAENGDADDLRPIASRSKI